MNKEAMEIWADELEFGDHTQVYTNLVRWNQEHEPTGFCGLGVACVAYANTHRLPLKVVMGGPLKGSESHIPDAVKDWLDIDIEQELNIIELNDLERIPLKEIGSWVRDNLLKEE